MKKRFLPISLLLTIIILTQTSFVVNANGGSGKYSPRTTMQATAQSFMKSIRANQESGLIDPAWLVASENSQVRSGEELNWASLGPDNYGSLTRGILYDKNDATNQTVYIGTMGGGVFQSVNGGITWKTVSDNMMVSCMVQTEDGTIYVGTGDGRSAQNHNGLSELNYETSFVGSGIFKLGDNTPVEGSSDWAFINDLATYENVVYAATSEGLYRYEGNTWTPMVDTISSCGVEVTSDGKILAVIGNEVCLFSGDECTVLTTSETNALPKDENYKIIAASPSDPNYMYVSYLTKNNGTGDIYVTSDGGITWQIAYKSTNMHDIHGDRGLLDNAMVVFPNDPRKVLIGGLNLWVLRDESGEGLFRIECISEGNGFQISQSGGTFYYNYKYIHTGIQAVTFNPSNQNEFFVGSEGGVFKGTYSSENGYLYEGANRYFETAENHTSVARMFSVACSDRENMVIGGSLDHGTINVYGDVNTNNVTKGSAIFPNDIATTDAATTYGSFEFTKAGGPCAISTLNSDIMFITTTGGYSIGTPLFRTQSAGVDYDKENFTYSATDNSTYIKNGSAFRTPIALFENYNDTKSIDSVKYYAKKNFKAGDVITDVKSVNCDYPFDYTLTSDLNVGDSILIQDVITSTFLVAINGKVQMTKTALQFSKKAEWWTILSSISGTPNALTMSSDGDVAYVGTLKGKLYRISGLSDAVNKDCAEGIPPQLEPRTEITDTIVKQLKKYDSIWSKKPVYDTTFANDTVWVNDEFIKIDTILINDTTFKTKTVYDTIAPAVPSIVVTKEIASDSVFNGRAITSVAIDPNDANKVIVTLGNYGNDDYVFYSTDGEKFTSVQNDLPKVPVYSSLIEKTSGLVILGTENGLYTSSDMTTWTPDSKIVNVPVMDIKQQLQENRPDRYIYLIDEVGDTTAVEYKGITNSNMIYIATYGRGLYKCDSFVNSDEENIQENVSTAKALEINIFPNPVVSEATINFNVEATSNVSYQIYDLSGRMVQNVTLGNYAQGSHSVTFNVDGLTTGTYIVRVQTGSVSKTSKILVY